MVDLAGLARSPDVLGLLPQARVRTARGIGAARGDAGAGSFRRARRVQAVLDPLAAQVAMGVPATAHARAARRGRHAAISDLIKRSGTPAPTSPVQGECPARAP